MRVSSRPEISTADTLMEKRAPDFSLRSSITLKSQEMAVGATPRLCVEQSRPIMVYVFPGGGGANKSEAEYLDVVFMCEGGEQLPRLECPKQKMQPSAPFTTDWMTSDTVPEHTSAYQETDQV